jgi:hypothetical protein
VATIYDVTKKSGRVLPRPSAVIHAYASVDTPWVARTRSHCIPVRWGKVSFNSLTHTATQFGDSICPVYVSTFQMLVHSDPADAGLNQHKRGLPPWSSEFMIQTTLNLSIQYSLFSLIAPPGLQLCQPFDHPAKPHRTFINSKGPITSRFQPLVFY